MKTTPETIAHIIRSIASYGAAITSATSGETYPWMTTDGPAVNTGEIRKLISGLQGTLAAYDAAQAGKLVSYSNTDGWVIA